MVLSNKINKDLSGRSGVAALPTMLLIGSIITGIAMALTASVFLYVNSTHGVNLSLQALSVAKSGVYDGIMKVARDKTIVSASYFLPVGKYNAQVTICQGGTQGCDTTAGNFLISSIGSILTVNKKMQAIVSVDNVSGEVKLQLMHEVAI
ncbi:MAG: hypothetical protein M1155_01795 [Patescibacteria group bacterium]|nr:hypothetical protein [Patescibacteria group bacterium]